MYYGRKRPEYDRKRPEIAQGIIESDLKNDRKNSAVI